MISFEKYVVAKRFREEAFSNRFASVYIVCRCDIFSKLFEKMSKMTYFALANNIL